MHPGAATVSACHDRTRHHFGRYARSLEVLHNLTVGGTMEDTRLATLPACQQLG